MKSGLKLNTSSRIVRAMARNPWPLISSLAMPMRRMAARMALSLIGRWVLRALEKTYRPRPVRGFSSRKIATACDESGTMCGVFVFETV